MAQIKATSKLPEGEKIINDPIHGTLRLNKLYMLIIDTPEFQRLRHIKQLGGVQHVYPGATHTRFEHSLGVCHLAELMVRNLDSKQPELQITEEDILCVGIAGLCHDLGHGPFSQVWEKFMMEAKPDRKWKHEEASCAMFDHIWNKMPENEREKFHLNEKDLVFIKELITVQDDQDAKEWPYEGRTREKSFLYDIVTNKKTGLDVDKWDYILRDSHYLRLTAAFGYERLLQSARVIEDDTGLKHICFRDKEIFNLYQMFHARWVLHRKAYQHRVTRIIEYMLIDAFHSIDKIIQIPGKKGLKPLSDCCDDMDYFIFLNDTIVQRILLEGDLATLKNNLSGGLRTAKEKIDRLERRKLYKEVGFALLCQEKRDTGNNQNRKDEIKKIRQQKKDEISKIKQDLIKTLPRKKEDFSVAIVDINYGKEEQDPINLVKFYRKARPDKIFKEANKEFVSRMLPSEFQEQMISCICRSNEKDVEKSVQDGFTQWRKELEKSGKLKKVLS